MYYADVSHFLDATPGERLAATTRGPAPLSLRGLIEALAALEAPPDLDSITSALHRLQAGEGELKRYVQYGRDKYRRNLVYRDRNFEVLVLCWLPGQHSPIHDHHGSQCGVLVVAGNATEVRFEKKENGRLRAASIQTLYAGAITGSSDDELHVVANWTQPQTNLVTLHVYSPPLTHMRVYGDDLVDRVSMRDVARLNTVFGQRNDPLESRPVHTAVRGGAIARSAAGAGRG